MSLIKAQDVTKIYGDNQNMVKALREGTFKLNESEFVAIMGPSGSGKTTLLGVLGGLNPPTQGKVIIDDIDIYDLGKEKLADFRREYLGFVFQEFQLVSYLTALQNVMLPLCITGYSNRKQEELARSFLDKVGLKSKYNRLPNQLSGGEQQRVAIARAIVNEPPIILADEPTGTLDSETGTEIIKLFKLLNQEGLTIVMVTHNPENTKFCGRIISIRDGVVKAE